jgi:hypothetical protein
LVEVEQHPEACAEGVVAEPAHALRVVGSERRQRLERRAPVGKVTSKTPATRASRRMRIRIARKRARRSRTFRFKSSARASAVRGDDASAKG